MDGFDAIVAEFGRTMDDYDTAYSGYESAMADVRAVLGGTAGSEELSDRGGPTADTASAPPTAAG